jgi:hypothetical protein
MCWYDLYFAQGKISRFDVTPNCKDTWHSQPNMEMPATVYWRLDGALCYARNPLSRFEQGVIDPLFEPF